MKYIADGLTVLRVLSAGLVLLLIWQDSWALAAAVFAFGILTDAFDGIAARRWTYSDEENARLWWRKDAHQFDNMADLALSSAGLTGITLSLLEFWWAVAVLAVVGLTSFVIQAIVDKTGPTNPKKAERIDVAHGWLFGTELTGMLVIMTVQATPNWPVVLLGYLLVGVPLLWLKWDRVTSRSELTYGA